MFRIDLIDKDRSTVKIFPETLDQICRLCLKENGTTNIFVGALAKNGKKYIDLISVLSVAQVKENDGLPSKICNSCATKLYDFYVYKQQIETTQILLCIALGKVIVQPAKQSKSSSDNLQLKNKNLNIQSEIITIDDDDDEDNETNFGYKNASSRFEKENVQKIRNIEDVMECWKENYSCISCNSNLKTDPELKFFSFPLDITRCNAWKKALKLDKIEHLSPKTLHKNVHLCNRHFAPSMFYGKLKNKLRKTAVPIDFTEDPRSKLKVTVQTENENHIPDIDEDINPDDQLCNESSDLSDDEVVPIAIADHINYTKKIKKAKKKVVKKEKEVKQEKEVTKEVKKIKSERTKFQCISFDEKGNKIYTCCFCLEKFEDRHLYKKHKFREYSKRRERPKTKIACSICGKLVGRVRIKAHMVTHGKEKPHVCDICGKRYRSRSNLNDHTLTHKGVKNKVCELCGKSFYYACQLQVHLQSHYEVPNFMCHMCGYICSSKPILKRHEENHLLGKKMNTKSIRLTRRYNILKEKRTECDICHKEFPHPSQLVIHMRTHTGERPYKCQYCSKAFQQQGQLDYHHLLHTGVKAYECSFCGKKFTLNGNLQQHIRTHTGDKPHQCDLCEKRFYTNSAVRKHKKIHAKNNLGFKLF